MGEVGADGARGRRSAHRVARAATRSEKQLPPAPGDFGGWLGGGAAWPCSHASNSAGGMATTSSAMSACGPPQYSAHWPRNTPAWSACRRRCVVRPGIMSILPPRFGTQKLWMTSADCSVKRIGTAGGDADLVGGGDRWTAGAADR